MSFFLLMSMGSKVFGSSVTNAQAWHVVDVNKCIEVIVFHVWIDHGYDLFFSHYLDRSMCVCVWLCVSVWRKYWKRNQISRMKKINERRKVLTKSFPSFVHFQYKFSRKAGMPTQKYRYIWSIIVQLGVYTWGKEGCIASPFFFKKGKCEK